MDTEQNVLQAFSPAASLDIPKTYSLPPSSRDNISKIKYYFVIIVLLIISIGIGFIQNLPGSSLFEKIRLASFVIKNQYIQRQFVLYNSGCGYLTAVPIHWHAYTSVKCFYLSFYSPDYSFVVIPGVNQPGIHIDMEIHPKENKTDLSTPPYPVSSIADVLNNYIQPIANDPSYKYKISHNVINGKKVTLFYESRIDESGENTSPEVIYEEGNKIFDFILPTQSKYAVLMKQIFDSITVL